HGMGVGRGVDDLPHFRRTCLGRLRRSVHVVAGEGVTAAFADLDVSAHALDEATVGVVVLVQRQNPHGDAGGGGRGALVQVPTRDGSMPDVRSVLVVIASGGSALVAGTTLKRKI